MADGDVDAFHPETTLVDDGIDGDSGLTGLAVPDDQLSLASTHRDEGVYGLDAGLHRFMHRLASGDPGGLDLHPTPGHIGQRTLAINGLAHGVHHPTQQTVTYRHVENAARGSDRLTLVDMTDLAQHHRADGSFVEVEGQAQGAVSELK